MSRRRQQQHYQRLPQEDEDDEVDTTIGDAIPAAEAQREGFTASQFARPPIKIPYKAILLSIFLFIIGTISLVFSILIVTGYVHEKYLDRLWPLFILGSIMFIPGFYHVRIAYLAFMQRPGYSFEDIPEYNR